MEQWYQDLAARAKAPEQREEYLARASECAEKWPGQVDHYGQQMPQLPKRLEPKMVHKKAPPPIMHLAPPGKKTPQEPKVDTQADYSLLTSTDWDELMTLHLLLTQPAHCLGEAHDLHEVIQGLGEALRPHLLYLAYNVAMEMNREGFREFFISYQMNGGQESGLTAEDLVNIASKAYTSRSSTPEGETVSELFAKEFIDFIQAGAPGFALEPDAEAEPAAPGYAHEPGGERDEDNQPNNKKAR